jgi:hypothetical protein
VAGTFHGQSDDARPDLGTAPGLSGKTVQDLLLDSGIPAGKELPDACKVPSFAQSCRSVERETVAHFCCLSAGGVIVAKLPAPRKARVESKQRVTPPAAGEAHG